MSMQTAMSTAKQEPPPSIDIVVVAVAEQSLLDPSPYEKAEKVNFIITQWRTSDADQMI